MGKIQECNKGCKKLITVQFDTEISKYVPYEVDLSGNPTQRHSCPNSMYNKQQQVGQVAQQQQMLQPAPQPPGIIPVINTPSLETHLLNQLSQKIEELQKQLNDLKYFTEQQIQTFLKTELGEIKDVSKNSNIMLDAIVAHLKLTEPKKASELYNNEGAE